MKRRRRKGRKQGEGEEEDEEEEGGLGGNSVELLLSIHKAGTT